MPAGHFPFALCCLWLLSADCLSSVIGLTFPLYVLAALHFPKSIRVTSVFSVTTAKQIAAGLKHLQIKKGNTTRRIICAAQKPTLNNHK